ncbi:hypothetical protein [Spirillospora sp. CA-294931]|uniref:hypothetical protein n=1 Tax=Spirillospora sp. CA-294931 TaxID=3240042 RepID=UPI003D8C1A31
MRFRPCGMAIVIGGVLLVPAPSTAAETPPAEVQASKRVLTKKHQTPAARRKAAAAHRVTVRVLDRNGLRPATGKAPYFGLFDLETGGQEVGHLVDGTGTMEIPAGSYRVGARVITPEPGRPKATAAVVSPRMDVTADATVVLDARTTREVRVSLDDKDATMDLGDAIVAVTTRGEYQAYMLDLADGAYVTPGAGTPLHVQSTWKRPGHRYHLLNSVVGGVPERPEFRVRTRDLAAVRTKHAVPGAEACAGLVMGPEVQGLPFILSYGTVLGRVPGVHTLHVTPGNTVWKHEAAIGGPDCSLNPAEFQMGTERFPRRGKRARTWPAAPLTPTLWTWDAGTLVPGVQRTGDRLAVEVSLFSNGRPGYRGPLEDPITGETTLEKDGAVLGTSPYPGYGEFEVPSGPGRFRLRTTAARSVGWSTLGTRAEAEWTFDSAADSAPVIMTVGYDAGLDDHSRAPAGREHRVRAHIQTPPGVRPGRIERFGAEVSYDDGKSWRPAAARAEGGRWVIGLAHPADAEHVSLRTTVRDASGNEVRQTTIRAYALHR